MVTTSFPRFGVLPEGEDAVELDRLITYFYRLPNLPKLANADVLRSCLVEGVSKKVFGLASGAAWDAEDAVLRFGVKVDPTEVQFQPGTFLVRATAISALQAARKQEAGEEDEDMGGPMEEEADPSGDSTSSDPEPLTTTIVRELVITVPNVPVDKARDVLKTAVLPLAAESSDVTVTFSIQARAGGDGFSRNTVDLVVREGLHQLGLKDVKVEEGPGNP